MTARERVAHRVTGSPGQYLSPVTGSGVTFTWPGSNCGRQNVRM